MPGTSVRAVLKGLLAAALVAITTASVGTATAKAEVEYAPWSEDAEISYEIALGYWGVSAPPLCTSVTKHMYPGEIPTTSEEVPLAAGTATQPDEPTPCVVTIEAEMPFVATCQVMVHEVGHLLGYGHSPDPNSIMNANPTVQIPACWEEQFHRENWPVLAKRFIEEARKQCVRLRDSGATLQRREKCRHTERLKRDTYGKFLDDPY